MKNILKSVITFLDDCRGLYYKALHRGGSRVLASHAPDSDFQSPSIRSNKLFLLGSEVPTGKEAKSLYETKVFRLIFKGYLICKRKLLI